MSLLSAIKGKKKKSSGNSKVSLKALWDRYDPKTIGLNMGGDRGHDSGLTHDSYEFLVDALGSEAESRFTSAVGLIEDVFDTRLPSELEPVQAALNRMLEQLHQLLAREQRFIADAAHELRTPLAVLKIHAENAMQAAHALD